MRACAPSGGRSDPRSRGRLGSPPRFAPGSAWTREIRTRLGWGARASAGLRLGRPPLGDVSVRPVWRAGGWSRLGSAVWRGLRRGYAWVGPRWGNVCARPVGAPPRLTARPAPTGRPPPATGPPAGRFFVAKTPIAFIDFPDQSLFQVTGTTYRCGATPNGDAGHKVFRGRPENRVSRPFQAVSGGRHARPRT